MEFIGYCRVSSKGQEDGTSLKTQEEWIRNYAKYASNAEVVDVVADVETGSKLERSNLWVALRRLVCKYCPVQPLPKKGKDRKKGLDLKEAIEAPCPCGKKEGLDGMIAYDLDRLGRDAQDLLYLGFDFFAKRNKQLVIINGQGKCDTTSPSGKLNFLIFAGIAQYQREVLLEKLEKGQKYRASSGEYACGRPPYGFRRFAKGMLEEVESEQHVLKIIKRMNELEISAVDIARYLNRCGYRKRSLRGKPAQPWDRRGVLSILNQNQIRDWMAAGKTYNYVNYALPESSAAHAER